MTARFLQIHTLTSYPASLLNRDDAGFAKRMPFGGAIRTRISSQCLKRHWRTFEGENSLKGIDAPQSVRSRISFERFVVEPLVKDGVKEDVARHAAAKLQAIVFGSDAKQKKAEKAGKKGKKKGDEVGETTAASAAEPASGEVASAQVTVLGRPELDYMLSIAREATKGAGDDLKKVDVKLDEKLKDKGLKANIQALNPGSLEAGLGAALFGRMVTGDILARTDAAIHVAHAMTVHGQLTESDYFSAIDDLLREDGEQGSGHINASELTSGLFYGYVVVDVDGLVRNLGGTDHRKLAGDVVEKLINIIATVSPGAKLGSTAPYAYSHLVLVEAGARQPRTLANAFLEPVSTRGNVIENAYASMRDYIKDFKAMYGEGEAVMHAGMRTGEGDEFGAGGSLADVAEWSRKQVEA